MVFRSSCTEGRWISSAGGPVPYHGAVASTIEGSVDLLRWRVEGLRRILIHERYSASRLLRRLGRGNAAHPGFATAFSRSPANGG
jgi:hypothetical protein